MVTKFYQPRLQMKWEEEEGEDLEEEGEEGKREGEGRLLCQCTAFSQVYFGSHSHYVCFQHLLDYPDLRKEVGVTKRLCCGRFWAGPSHTLILLNPPDSLANRPLPPH